MENKLIHYNFIFIILQVLSVMHRIGNDSHLVKLNHTIDQVARYIALSASIILPILMIIGSIGSVLVGTHVVRTNWKKPLIIDRLILNLFVAGGIFIASR